MPKLPRLNTRQVIALLRQRGFVLDHATGSHYIFYHLASKRRVVVPFHRRTLPLGTLLAILRAADIHRDELIH